MNIFITGASGYIGRPVVAELLRRGHAVRALVRPSSIDKLPKGAEAVIGDALDASTFAAKIAPCDTFIQLVGVAHPSPAKAREFREIDLVSVRESVRAVRDTTVRHFLYLSVAQPAPVMQEYLAVRAEGERLVRESGLHATFIRPWYVLGPGHRWPYLLLPLYWLWSAFPKHRDTARRLYPVKLAEIVQSICDAAEDLPMRVRIIEAPEIRGADSPARPDVRSVPAHRPQ
ncbi:MAG TPA: NAD(P)H-binding protein [Thermoanaerobaculia bacterium]|nr:NAD(P)H-binding protein [Thermoanaerobaculia bacterium]